MKRIALLLSVVLSLSGCRTWSPIMMEKEKAPIENKLPSLQLYSGTEYNAEILSQTEFRLFREEMENNIMSPYGDKFGSAFYSSRTIENKEGFGYFFTSAMTLYFINLVGFPIHRVEKTIEVELRILDLKGRLIGKYTGRGSGKAYIALYYGFDWVSAYDKVMYESVNEALSNIRAEINQDAERIRAELLKTEKEIQSEGE